MLTPCKKVPCKSSWCNDKKKCWLYESYKPSSHRDPYVWKDGKYIPVKKTSNRFNDHDTYSLFKKRPKRPIGVSYPKFEFDTKENECFYCETELTKETRTRDHVFPRTKGGILCKGNMVWSCKNCNSHKGNMTLIEFKDKLNQYIIKKNNKYFTQYFEKILIKVEFMITKLYPK